MTIQREPLLARLRAVLEPLDYVQAMWEGGAAAFDRVDTWSDIDLQIAVDDERVADAVKMLEQALPPIDLRYEIPQPTWHGFWQTFYRFQDASPFLLLDMVVMKTSAQEKFLTLDIHGQARVHFDKIGFTRVPALDSAAHQAHLRRRLESIHASFPLFQVLILKEIHRGNTIEAISFFQGFTLRPLVELLRIKHCPARYQFHTRYVQYDLPSDVVKQLESYFFVRDLDDLRAKHADAEVWATALLHELRSV